MKELLNTLENIQDTQQEHKVLHKLSEVVFIVLLALLFLSSEKPAIVLIEKPANGVEENINLC